MVPIGALAAAPLTAPGQTTRDTDVPKSQIVFLGTGTPNADPDRSGPGVAIVVGDTPYLIDAGPGIVRRAEAARRKGVEALRVPNLEHLFITHLHSDHTLGLPDFIFSPWVLGRDQPLKVYGPPGTAKMVEHLLAAYEQDIHMRRDGLEGANERGYKVDVYEIKPGEVYRDEKVRVRAFPVKHGSWEEAFGFRFETPDRVIVISGDTAPSEELIENARGCDVLIHEVYSADGFTRRPPKWQRYHSSFHTSSLELAKIAEQVKPGLLILYHQLFWDVSEEKLLQEVKSAYGGRVESADDLDIY
jgi:ribonuclease BN (tRNA processing enzyme)